MRNITGSPVEHEDFFDRPREIARVRRNIANDNILLTAPRRVGKTSLVLRVCELERVDGRSAVFLNVEGCHDELAFAEKLVHALRQSGLNPDALSRVSLALGRARQALKGLKLGAAGVDLQMGAADEPDHGTLGRAIESIFANLEADGPHVVVAIDEMPELLVALAKEDHGPDRVSRFLHWLRALRQTYRRNVRWIFLGSIGLDTFVDDRRLANTVNDLAPLTLEALDGAEADAFLSLLGDSNGLPLSAEVRSAMIERVGWPLPHHLQMLFHALVDAGTEVATPDAVQNAFDQLLQPGNLTQFDTWRHRLDLQFTPPDALAANDILRQLCQQGDRTGRSRDAIFNGLMATRQNADPAEVEDRLARLLQMLQRDGYVLERDGRYGFRSFLLREYWHHRVVR